MTNIITDYLPHTSELNQRKECFFNSKILHILKTNVIYPKHLLDILMFVTLVLTEYF